jgi:hypothetical protein
MKRSLILLAFLISAWLAPIPALGDSPTPPPPPLRPTMIVITPVTSKTPLWKPTLAAPTKTPVGTSGPVVSPAPRLEKHHRLYLPWIAFGPEKGAPR